MKGDRMANRSSFGSVVRKKLSDISNSVVQPKSQVHGKNLSPSACSAKNYIDQLHKENVALVKLIADKNKIIELAGLELQKLRINLQKTQLQNWNLAQSNSHILVELNLGKEKLKSLQHELVCKEALLKAKILELKGQCKMNNQRNECQDGEKALNNQHKCESVRRTGKRPAARRHSMGPSTTLQQDCYEKVSVDNKRRCLRRKSARFKYHEHEPSESLFEIKDLTLDARASEDHSTLSQSSYIKEEEHEENCIPFRHREMPRTSLGRPARRAAVKVQSYKEVPLNIKMRRSE